MSAHRSNHPGIQLKVERPLASSPTLTFPTGGLSSQCGRLLLGLVFSSGIGLLAYRRRSLTGGGAAGAVVTGTAISGLGGWPWGISLIYFFISSTLLSRFCEKEKAHTVTDKFSKGSRRDLAQVVANGGVASLYAALTGTTRSSETGKHTLQAAFTGALATATADTWATELGILSPRKPRLLTTGRPVAPGTSGGITSLGMAAAALGALTFGLVLWIAQGPRKSRVSLPAISLLSGLTGSLCDSLLGATVQAMFFCPRCQCETERAVHVCGTRTLPSRGAPWCNNDVVNLFATVIGSFTAIILDRVLRRDTPSPEKNSISQEIVGAHLSQVTDQAYG